MSINHLTTAEFDAAVNVPGIAVVDFFATWCGPCKRLAPIMEKVSEQFTDVRFYKVDVDENPDLASRFRVMSIPTVIYMKDGEMANKTIGLLTPGELTNAINAVQAK